MVYCRSWPITYELLSMPTIYVYLIQQGLNLSNIDIQPNFKINFQVNSILLLCFKCPLVYIRIKQQTYQCILCRPQLYGVSAGSIHCVKMLKHIDIYTCTIIALQSTFSRCILYCQDCGNTCFKRMNILFLYLGWTMLGKQ